ncbi:hypothetical protein ACFLUO_02620 [Chloroflexota bacterium]
MATMYGLLIRDGEVVDPGQGLCEVLDIAIQGNRIERLDKGIDPGKAKEVINAREKVVTPGLIDMHCHVFGGIFESSAEPDDAGVKHRARTEGLAGDRPRCHRS